MIKRLTCFLCMYAMFIPLSQAQEQKDLMAISLNNLDAFTNPGPNWSVASDVTADFAKEGNMKAVSGTGVLVNNTAKKGNTNLVSKENFGDVELELDFMMVKGSNSGIYLQGRYELQLFDSWTTPRPTYSDCGGIYQRWDESRAEGQQGYQGIAPLMNVARAPGLWQHLRIVFRAPQFNGKGEKIANARFEEVYLNGVLVQQQTEVTGPTRSAAFEDEKSTGPLMIQGDHGNVAFRNMKYRSLGSASETPEKVDFDTPILVRAENEPYLLRSFLSFGKQLLTHCISVGNPNQVNYSYNLKQGALLQVWRGQFVNASDMWYQRGEPYQRSVPLGSVIELSNAPPVAVLADEKTTAWPAEHSFDEVVMDGYRLDENKNPTFSYAINGVNITDKIVVQDQTGLTRTLMVSNPPADLYCRIAASKNIEKISKGWYAAGDKSYYIKIDDQLKPVIRQTAEGQELLIAAGKANTPLTYSLIW